jgi:sigma-B regulation protein RsbU (phosphoserine phosphatase)
MMPEMSGPEFCREFRNLPRDSYGYFILLTSKSEKDDIAAGLDAGADDFLTKPVSGAELRARIAAGDRILRMERELTEKKRLVETTLSELRRVYKSLDDDLVEAKNLQQSLVRDRYRDFGLAEVSLALRSSGHVGGDLVGMFPIAQGRVGLFGIDVSGHGISSALMTARLAGYLSTSAPDQNVAFRRTQQGAYVPRSPAETVSVLNRLILDDMETEHYFTALLADACLQTGRVTVAQAGHPCPLVQRADGSVEFVGDGGLPVGLIQEAVYQEFEVILNPGDRLMIYSDGIVECADPQARFLGEAGLARMMRRLRHVRGPECLDSVTAALSDHAGSTAFGDDVSAVLMELKPGAESG